MAIGGGLVRDDTNNLDHSSLQVSFQCDFTDADNGAVYNKLRPYADATCHVVTHQSDCSDTRS